MSGLHARNAPSAASRWIRCPGSIAQCASIRDTATEYAAEGTVAHRIREDCLRYDMDPAEFVGREMSADGFSFKIDDSWAEHLEPGIDRIRDLGGKRYLEKRVYYHRWGRRPRDQFGHVDCGIILKRLIVVDDLKFGAGVPVDPVENEQLMIYALGFWDTIARHETDAKEMLISVDQPRAKGGGGEWRVKLKDLLEFGNRLKKAVELTYKRDAPLVPGPKQCQFCPAAEVGKCPAYTKFCLSMTGLDFDDLDADRRIGIAPAPEPADGMTPERKAFVALHASMFKKWIDSVHAATLSDALAGLPTPGVKAVVGRKGARYWTDEAAAEKKIKRLLGDEGFTKKLKSPTQVEPLLPVKEYLKLQEQKFIDQSDGKPSLVAEDHRGKAITPNAVEFDALD